MITVRPIEEVAALLTPAVKDYGESAKRVLSGCPSFYQYCLARGNLKTFFGNIRCC